MGEKVEVFERALAKSLGVPSKSMTKSIMIWREVTKEEARLTYANHLLNDIDATNPKWLKAKELLEERIDSLNSQLRELGADGLIVERFKQ